MPSARLMPRSLQEQLEILITHGVLEFSFDELRSDGALQQSLNWVPDPIAVLNGMLSWSAKLPEQCSVTDLFDALTFRCYKSKL
jgi:hypothetical protein